mgnify:CR=1 FL=1
MKSKCSSFTVLQCYVIFDGKMIPNQFNILVSECRFLTWKTHIMSTIKQQTMNIIRKTGLAECLLLLCLVSCLRCTCGEPKLHLPSMTIDCYQSKCKISSVQEWTLFHKLINWNFYWQIQSSFISSFLSSPVFFVSDCVLFKTTVNLSIGFLWDNWVKNKCQIVRLSMKVCARAPNWSLVTLITFEFRHRMMKTFSTMRCLDY